MNALQKKIEAMLGSQLFAIAGLSDQLDQAKARIVELEARCKELEDKYEPKAEEVKGKADGT